MNGASEIPKKIPRKEFYSVSKKADGEQGDDVAEANFRLGEEYYYYEKDPEGIQSAYEYFLKAQKLGHQNAEKYLALIEKELLQVTLTDPKIAVEVFNLLEIEQGEKLQLQEDEVRIKLEDLKQIEKALKDEIAKLREEDTVSLKKLENDLSKVREERHRLEHDWNELDKGRRMLEEVSKDTKSMEDWEEKFSIPFVGSPEELKDTVVSIAIDKVYINGNNNNIIELPIQEAVAEYCYPETPNLDFEEKLLEEDTIEGDDKTNFLEVSKNLQKVLEEISNIFYNNDAKDITVVVGETGAGKSTLCGWLTGNEMEVTEIKDHNGKALKGQYTFKDTEEISGGATSRTKRPQIKHIKRNEKSPVEYYGDCPGFHDNRGILQQIKNFYYIQHLSKNRRVKLLLAIHHAYFLLPRSTNLVDAFKTVQSLIKDPRKMLNSISLIVTHCPVGGDKLLVESKLRSDAENQESSLKELMLKVADSKRIAFFSLPDSLKPSNYQSHPRSDQEKRNLLNILSDQMKFLQLEKNDINFSPPFSEAKLLLIQLVDNLKIRMGDLLNQYAESVKDHFVTKRETFKTRVEHLVIQGLKYIPPLVLFRGLPKDFQDHCGKEIVVKAFARNTFRGHYSDLISFQHLQLYYQ